MSSDPLTPQACPHCGRTLTYLGWMTDVHPAGQHEWQCLSDECPCLPSTGFPYTEWLA